MDLIDLITWLNELNEGLLVIIFNDIFSVADAWYGGPLYTTQIYHIAGSKANFLIDHIEWDLGHF